MNLFIKRLVQTSYLGVYKRFTAGWGRQARRGVLLCLGQRYI